MQLISLFRTIFITLIAIVLSACGGSDNKNPPALVTQSFAFAQVGPANLQVGDELTNVAKGDGTGAVTYSSSNTAIATVSNTGTIVLVGVGDVIISASKAADDKYLAANASFTIHVRGLTQTFAFAQSGPINLFVGDTQTNIAVGQGTGAISYSSSDITVATVDSTGLVTATGAGSAVITANRVADTRYLAATTSYTVNSARISQAISFAQPGPIELSADQTFSNVATGLGVGTINYSSSNTDIATVNDAGVVSVLTSGSVTITANKLADVKYLAASASYVINSARIGQTFSVSQVGPLDVTVGESFLNPAVGQGIGAITYKSSNEAVATVNSFGRVTILGAGSSVITANIEADAKYFGSEVSYSIHASLASQTLSFAQQGPINLSLGDSLSNEAIGEGSGAVTYSSDDNSVATVDSSGVLTVTGVGTAIITADKAADARYLAATTSYTIHVGVKVTAWIGSQDTLVNFPSETNGFEFYRSSDSNCDFSNYLSCAFGQMDILSGLSVTDTATTLNRPGYFLLKNGSKQGTAVIDATVEGNTLLLNRFGSKVVSFNNKLFLIGGRIGSNYLNDVWQSDDGIHWTQITASAAFSPRMKPLILVKDNKLWLIGGEDDSSLNSPYKNDVWSSVDGITWIQQTDHAEFDGLTGASAATFKTFLSVVGGIEWGGRFRDEVWLSSNGILWWDQGVLCCDFGARADHQLVVYNNKLWLIGGRIITNFVGSYKNDVWSSNDGISWTQATANAAFPVERMTGAVAFNNKLWWFGGPNFNDLTQVWSSSDGITWTQQTIDAGPTVGAMTQALIHKGKLLLVRTDDKVEVWSSADGAVWRKGVGSSFQFSQ